MEFLTKHFIYVEGNIINLENIKRLDETNEHHLNIYFNDNTSLTLYSIMLKDFANFLRSGKKGRRKCY